MGTVETAKSEETVASAAEGRKDALTIKDERTGRVYEVPIKHGTIRAMDLRQIKTGPDDFGLMTYDPAFLNTAALHEPHHLHRRRQGDPAVPRLPDRGARGEVHVSRGRVPAALRRAAQPQAVRRVGPRDHVPHDDPREPEEGHGRLQLRRAPDGDADRDGRRDVDLLPRGTRRPRPGRADQAGPPPHRQDADDRGVRLQALDGHALRLSLERPGLHVELPHDALQDARRELQAEPDAGAGARHSLHPPRGPRAELRHQRHARDRLGAHGPLLGRSPARRRRCTGRSTAARTRRS